MNKKYTKNLHTITDVMDLFQSDPFRDEFLYSIKKEQENLFPTTEKDFLPITSKNERDWLHLFMRSLLSAQLNTLPNPADLSY